MAGQHFEVFTVRDGEGEGKSWWTKIGAAFKNKDGSLSVVLDALPVNGRLQIRKPREKDETAAPDKSDSRKGKDSPSTNGDLL